MILGDITRSEVLIYAVVGIWISGLVGSTLFPTFSYFSQILSINQQWSIEITSILKG